MSEKPEAEIPSLAPDPDFPEALEIRIGSSTRTKEILDRYLRIRDDPMEFLLAVRTKDEVDRKNPIKQFPAHELEYLRFYVRAWQSENLIAVPKSRRMKMSWTNVALFLWDTMFHQGRHTAFVSKKEEDSDALVKRAEFIYDNLDPQLVPRDLLPQKLSKYCTLAFPEIQSKISGFPSGADQLRQFTLSGILGDECAFWIDTELMYSATYPTIEGGGKFVMLSSPAPGFFKRLVFDQLDSREEFDPDIVIGQALRKNPLKGVTCWKNPKNRFFVFELHYTADPAKCDPDWISKQRASMPIRAWRQEYELQWDTFTGLPVYMDFDRISHVQRGLRPIIGLPLLRGWDFGLTPACVIAQLQGRRLTILHEFTELNMGTDRFSDLVLKKISVLYPQWGSGRDSDWIDFIDPAGLSRDQSNEGTSARILDSKGLTCYPGEIAFESRKKAVETFLTGRDSEGYWFAIDPETCPVLLRGFEGGYRYPESILGKEPNQIKPVKDEHSHPHDAVQYISTGILNIRPKGLKLVQPPRQRFAFGRTDLRGPSTYGR